MSEVFRKFAQTTARLVGTPYAFILALAVVLVWALTGPLFGFSDTWQLVINTGTTIVTFLMVFLIQNTQNRDSRALQLKLDELVRAVHEARNELVDIEDMPDKEMEALAEEFQELREQVDNGTQPSAAGAASTPQRGTNNAGGQSSPRPQ